MDTKFSKMEQSLGTKLVNAVKNHQKENNEKPTTTKTTGWYYTALKPGELHTKNVDGDTYKWCQKC